MTITIIPGKSSAAARASSEQFSPFAVSVVVVVNLLMVPWITVILGLGSGLGLGLCLIIRFRDPLVSLVGLGLTMKYLTWQGKAGIINVKS